MKKCIVIIICIIFLGIIVINKQDSLKDSNLEDTYEKNILAFKLETEVGSGEYIESNDTSWPKEGYVFNANLSVCENGSHVYWDEASSSVVIEAGISDKCYIYFDMVS